MTSTRVVAALVVLALAAAVMTPGCGSSVSKDNYDKVATGMTVEQVKDILGEPTETGGAGGEVAGIGGSASVMTWKDGDKSITVTFVNNKVTAKAQANL